jgi:hypothetical protein
LVLVHRRAVDLEEAILSVPGGDQREHVLEGHQNELVVAVAMASVSSGVGVDLGDYPQVGGTRESCGSTGGVLVGEYELRSALALRAMAGENERVLPDLPPGPPDETLVRGSKASGLEQERLRPLDDARRYDKGAPSGPLGERRQAVQCHDMNPGD